MAIISIPKALSNKLGEEATEGLVELMKSTYGDQKIELFSLLEERFHRKIEMEISSLRKEMHDEIGSLRKEMHDLSLRIEEKFTEVQKQFGELQKQIIPISNALVSWFNRIFGCCF